MLLQQEMQQTFSLEQTILGSSLPIKRLREEIQTVAQSSETVLILGETGVGKELVAHGIRMSNGGAGHPFVTVNVPAISHDLVESELFGHRRGSFTGAVEDRMGVFEEARGGTLFLDEIGDMSFGAQVKLLRVLESGEVRRVGDAKCTIMNVRVVAATNHDLESDVRAGKFRLDLFHRLNVLPITVPPLRMRRTDIRLLAKTFLQGRDPTRQLGDTAVRRLDEHGWPGNVRELKNAIDRARIYCKDCVIQHEAFSFLDGPTALSGEILPLRTYLGERRRDYILRAFDDYPPPTNTEVARRLGISRTALCRFIKQYDLDTAIQSMRRRSLESAN